MKPLCRAAASLLAVTALSGCAVYADGYGHGTDYPGYERSQGGRAAICHLLASAVSGTPIDQLVSSHHPATVMNSATRFPWAHDSFAADQT